MGGPMGGVVCSPSGLVEQRSSWRTWRDRAALWLLPMVGVRGIMGGSGAAWGGDGAMGGEGTWGG